MTVGTYDTAYNTVDRDNFDAMIEVGRYAKRSEHFDEIIERTREHFWNPADKAYIDYDLEFDRHDYPVTIDMVPELQCAVADKLTEDQKVDFAWENHRWIMSQLLHGEQGALSLSSSLIDIFLDPGAQEYVTNQAREEARHVCAFAKYIFKRWPDEGPTEVGPTLGSLLREMIHAPDVYKKVIGMQMMIEGLAMGAFATMHKEGRDPVLKRLVQLVMTDEAFHHQFGKIWAKNTVPHLTEEEHEQAEDWAQYTFQNLFENLVNSQQKAQIYPKFGLTQEWVSAAMMEAFTEEDSREDMLESTNIFRVLVKTLAHGGLITDRSRAIYETWVDVDELKREKDEVVSKDVVEAGLADLQDINSSKRTIVKLLDSEKETVVTA